MTVRTDHRLARKLRLLALLLLAAACSAVHVPAAGAASPHRTDAARRLTGGGAARLAGRVGRSASGHAARARKKPRKPALRGNPARAELAFQAMQKHYYIPGSGLYEGEPFSALWPFSQGFAATVGMANIPHLGISFSRELRARLVGLSSYLDADNSGAAEGTFTSTLTAYDATVAPPVGPGGAKYYDDNDWVGIELLRLYELSHSPSVLNGAETIMAFEMAGWQSSPGLGCPGGVPFSNDPENIQRNTVSTAPAAELGAQLYRVTHNVSYLQFAVMAYLWARQCLLQPSGLYADHVNRKGVVEGQLWSYNQGTMIGAGTLLYQATGNPGYLNQARETAKAALAYFTPERLGSEIAFFPSVYFRNLLYLDSVTHDPPGPRIAQAYVDYAWTHLRLNNDLFVGGSPPVPELLVQAAIVQIYALLSSPARSYF